MSKYPSGYRFNPTDEEIITYYLLPKICNQLLPNVNLPMVAINQYLPETLIKEFQDTERFSENELIVFTNRIQKHNKGRRPNRITVGGFWKPTGSDKKIKNSNGIIIGKRTNLDYYEGVQGEDGCRRTPWKMHEYVPHSANDKESKKFQELVICKIYMNSRSKDKDNVEVSELKANVDGSDLVLEEETEYSHKNNSVIIQETANNNNGYAPAHESFTMEQHNNIICDANGFALSSKPFTVEEPNDTVQSYNGNNSSNINQEYMENFNHDAGTSSHHFLATPGEPTYPSMNGNKSLLTRSSESHGINFYNKHGQNLPTNEPVVRFGISSILACPISYNFTTNQDQNYNT